ncbi:hypothetical protein BDR26DRAFT_852655 [Obelidium mucronatum]|nr:hypothetical protein BDR26DRAFT_852655 [Obelidium mucronatum]
MLPLRLNVFILFLGLLTLSLGFPLQGAHRRALKRDDIASSAISHQPYVVTRIITRHRSRTTTTTPTTTTTTPTTETTTTSTGTTSTSTETTTTSTETTSTSTETTSTSTETTSTSTETTSTSTETTTTSTETTTTSTETTSTSTETTSTSTETTSTSTETTTTSTETTSTSTETTSTTTSTETTTTSTETTTTSTETTSTTTETTSTSTETTTTSTETTSTSTKTTSTSTATTTTSTETTSTSTETTSTSTETTTTSTETTSTSTETTSTTTETTSTSTATTTTSTETTSTTQTTTTTTCLEETQYVTVYDEEDAASPADSPSESSSITSKTLSPPSPSWEASETETTFTTTTETETTSTSSTTTETKTTTTSSTTTETETTTTSSTTSETSTTSSTTETSTTSSTTKTSTTSSTSTTGTSTTSSTSSSTSTTMTTTTTTTLFAWPTVFHDPILDKDNHLVERLRFVFKSLDYPNLCLQADSASEKIISAPCDDTSESQHAFSTQGGIFLYPDTSIGLGSCIDTITDSPASEEATVVAKAGCQQPFANLFDKNIISGANQDICITITSTPFDVAVWDIGCDGTVTGQQFTAALIDHPVYWPDLDVVGASGAVQNTKYHTCVTAGQNVLSATVCNATAPSQQISQIGNAYGFSSSKTCLSQTNCGGGLNKDTVSLYSCSSSAWKSSACQLDIASLAFKEDGTIVYTDGNGGADLVWTLDSASGDVSLEARRSVFDRNNGQFFRPV